MLVVVVAALMEVLTMKMDLIEEEEVTAEEEVADLEAEEVADLEADLEVAEEVAEEVAAEVEEEEEEEVAAEEVAAAEEVVVRDVWGNPSQMLSSWISCVTG